MIAEPIKPVDQIRPDIEDESSNDEAERPESGEKSAERSRQRLASRHRRGAEKCDGAEAEQRQADEGEIDPEQSADKWRERRQVTAQVHGFGHRRSGPSQSEMERACDL